MNNMVRWNLPELMNAIQSLENQHNQLERERTQMQTQNTRVGANWQSSAGNMYRGRLNEDMQALNDILRDLQNRISQLRRVHGFYSDAENRIRSSVARLPR